MEETVRKIESGEKVEQAKYFDLAQFVCNKINASSDSEKLIGRNTLIVLLSKWETLPDFIKPILSDIVEAVGFYPYLGKLNISTNNFDARIRQVHHQSKYLNNKFLHAKQKELSDLVLSEQNVIVSAPTSFGKSLLIEEVVASKLYKNIVIIQPTLALLDETRIKLKNYENSYKLIVRTSQPHSDTKGNIFLLTAERVLEYENMPKIDLLILDEFYKLSNKRGDNRSNILNIAFLKLLNNHKCKFYLLGPNIDNISEGFAAKYNAVFFHTNYSMVCTETENKFDDVKIRRGNKVEEEDLFNTLDKLSDQTLVFCSSPATARKVAFQYCEHLVKIGMLKVISLPIVQWINENIAYEWSLTKCLQSQIGVHDGALPKHIATSIIQYFNAGKISILFCTNTIIEGVNTSAKNVVFYDNKIGTRDIDYFDYANIRGRAGRLMEHYVGKVINLRKPPEEQSFEVDIPFFEQNPIDDEVLMNIDKKDLKNIGDNIAKYEEFQKHADKLKTILLRNNVSIAKQLEVLKILFDDLQDSSKKNLIVWSQVDKLLNKRLEYVFDLCWERFSTKDENSIGSKKWIVHKTVDFCYKSSIAKIVRDDIEYRCKKLQEKNELSSLSIEQCYVQFPIEMQHEIDLTIEIIFKLQKNWFQYKIPKWINIVNSLQEYACELLGITAGNYSYVAEIIENERIDENCRILIEYGVPHSAVTKLQDVIKSKFGTVTEDSMIEIIRKNKISISKILTEYEMDAINRSI